MRRWKYGQSCSCHSQGPDSLVAAILVPVWVQAWLFSLCLNSVIPNNLSINSPFIQTPKNLMDTRWRGDVSVSCRCGTKHSHPKFSGLKQQQWFLTILGVYWEVLLVWTSSLGLDGIGWLHALVWQLAGWLVSVSCGLTSFSGLAQDGGLRAPRSSQCFPSLCLCLICYCSVDQSKSHEHAQSQGERG